MTEIWKPVLGFHGYYEVSNLGQVRSVDRTIVNKTGKRLRYRGRVLKQAIDGNGYSRVGLWKGDVQTGRIVHRLVAAAFLRKTKRGEEVNHIDHDKRNNNFENLEIITRAENMAHAASAGRMAKKLNDEAVREIKYSMLWGDDKYALARRFGVTRECVNAIVWGQSWKRVDLPGWLASHD